MKHILKAAVAAFVIVVPAAVFAQEEAEVDPKYTWDLTEIYPSVEAWAAARDEVMARYEQIEARRGTLGDSADDLYETLALISDTLREGARVSTYASLNADEDLRNSDTQANRQLAQVMFSRFSEATAWVQPEILEVGEEVITAYLNEDDRLERFRFQLEDSLRNAPHTLTPEAEEALSYFGQAHGSSQTIYQMVADSDIPWPTVTLSTGEEGVIDSQGYSRFRGAENRDDRKLVFDAFWNKWLEYRNTVGPTLNGHVQTQVALAKARNYDSVLHRELFQDNIPEDVYRTLVTEVNAALPTLHRYFRLRAQMLGVDEMRYYDIYPPLVSLDKEFDIETSKAITLEAMDVLGDDWVDMQREAMSERWMHVYPSRGKRSGAYMSPGAYDVHPYLLLNHNDDYESLSTLAHEWGHCLLYTSDAADDTSEV